MPAAFRLALAALLTVAFAGCDSNNAGEERFEGTWSFTRVSVDSANVTSLVLARYQELVITFVAEEDRFVLFGDVEGTAEDLRLEGFYSVSESSDALRLEFDPITGGVGFISMEYQFLGVDEVRLIAENGDAVVWSDLLDVEFGEVEEVRLVLNR